MQIQKSQRLCCLLLIALFAMSLIFPVRSPAAPTEPEPLKRMMAQGYYFREPTDRAWTLKITGNIPSLPGAYLILHNAAGKVLYKGYLPYGEYSAAKPFIVNFPPDGMTGDYELHILGTQNDFLGIDLPMSDLPFEAYGGEWLSFNFAKTPVPFKARAGITVLGMRSYGSYLKVLDDQMQIIADARAGIKLMTPADSNKNFYNTRDHPIEFPIDPDRYYWLTGEMMYFEPREPIFFATVPAKLFEPDAKLDAVKWWEL
jgi:hypothetical protein